MLKDAQGTQSTSFSDSRLLHRWFTTMNSNDNYFNRFEDNILYDKLLHNYRFDIIYLEYDMILYT